MPKRLQRCSAKRTSKAGTTEDFYDSDQNPEDFIEKYDGPLDVTHPGSLDETRPGSLAATVPEEIDFNAEGDEYLADEDLTIPAPVTRTEQEKLDRELFAAAWQGKLSHHKRHAGWTDAHRVQEVQRLIAAGADPSSRHELMQETPMMRAAKEGLTDVVAALAAAGADVDAVDKYGKTPLMIAAFWGRGSTVDWLLTHGADRNAKDAKGNSAFRWGVTPNALRQYADMTSVSRAFTKRRNK